MILFYNSFTGFWCQFSGGIPLHHFLSEFWRWEVSNPSIWSRLWCDRTIWIWNRRLNLQFVHIFQKRLRLPPNHVLTQAELCSFRQITSQKPWQGSEVNVKGVPEVVFTGNLKCDLGCGKMWELSWTNCQSQFVRRNDLQFLLRSIRRSREPVTIDTQVTLEHFGCSEYICRS